MHHVTSAARTLSEAIRQGRIGTPVSIRVSDHTAADHGRIEPLLAGWFVEAGRWLGSEPSSWQAVGGVEGGEVAILLRFASGATAILAVGGRAASPPRLELTAIGNEGIASWEPPDPEELDAVAGPAEPDPDEAGRLRAASNAIRAAMSGSTPLPPSSVGADPGPSPRKLAPPYGILLIAGGGTHQEDYARALADEPRCRLVGLSDEAGITPRRRAENEQLARVLEIPWLPDLDAALARDDVQVVSVCAEPERRARIIVRCAEAGKHLYLDKPLATSSEEGRRIVEAARRAGVCSQMFSMVHAGMAPRARALVRSGRLGEIRAVHVDLLFAKGTSGTARLGTPRVESRRPVAFETIDAKRELSNVGVYPLVFLRWLLGRAVRRVSAATGNYFFREHQRADMEDFGVMLLELEGGITATVMAGRTGWRSHPMGGLNRALIVGTRGVATVDTYRPRMEFWNAEPPWPAPAPGHDDPMGFWRSTPIRLGLPPKRAWLTPEVDPPAVADARAFLDALEAGRPSEVDARAAAAALDVLTAAYASAADGRPVAVG